MTDTIHLGFEVGTGNPVAIPLRHTVITGQSQEAGKTTTLEALIARSRCQALAFITKRGERSFTEAKRVPSYFRERADWQFVASILEASRGERLKFERSWIMRASKGAHTLADVQRNVRREMANPKTKGLNADMYMQLDAYLEEIVPDIERVEWAKRIVLSRGVNVMDLTSLKSEMQHLVIRSSIEWVQEQEEKTIVIVPEAWLFIPQGRGAPVKLAAEKFIRQGAALGNYLWLDSQDIAGVDKAILKQVPVWVLGVQREANEVKRTLDQIPAGIKKPKADAIATLGVGQFFAAHGSTITKTYVQPVWMTADEAQAHARGEPVPPAHRAHAPRAIAPTITEEPTVNEKEAQALREENASLKRRLDALEAPSRATAFVIPPSMASGGTTDARRYSAEQSFDNEAMYQAIKRRLIEELPSDPAVMRIVVSKPELRVQVERAFIEVDGKTPKGRVARLLADGWFDGEGKTQSGTRSELSRTGPDTNSGTISTIFTGLVKDGFLTAEAGGLFRSVAGMKVNVTER